MYDWANSAFTTTIITAIFPVYFTSVAGADLPPGEATRLLARTTTIALGNLGDPRPLSRRARRLCAHQETAARLVHGDRLRRRGCLALVHRGDWLLAAVLFGVGNIGFTASLTFYDSLASAHGAAR